MNWLGRLFGQESAPDTPELAEGAVIIDVRSPAEYAGGHIEGSTNIPLDVLQHRIAQACPDKDQALILCCASGMRSGSARNLLVQMGYTHVTNGGGAGGLSMKLGRQIVRE
ncbi:rhodanese-like domain-containing protein [Burkholderiaceae bacterium DAT-1]|nr:rhodanese-like domain-containing protein [Burkholderiaceae bacterium DAT-1]